MGAPAKTELDMAHPPTTDELLEALTRNSRISLADVKKYPHGHVFEEPVRIVEPRSPSCRAKLDLGNEVMLGELGEVAEEEIPRESEFAFRLVARRLLEIHNSAGRDIPKLVRKYQYNPAFMHPDDLEALGVAAGDVVEIESDHSRILGVAESESGLRRGVVSMPHAFGDAPTPENDARVRSIGSNTGRLSPVDRHYDPYTGIPRMSAIPVHVRAFEGPLAD